MAVYSDTSAAPVAFATDPTFTVPFQPKSVTIINEDVDPANEIEVSFDGVNVAGKLIPGTVAGYKWNQNSSLVWIRGVGSAVGRIIAEG